MKFTTWALSATLLAASSLGMAAGLSIDNAWARFSAPGMTSSGVFLTLNNQSDAADTLVGASTPVAKKVELHTHSKDSSGVMRMREVSGGIDLPKGQTVQLQPGGLHVMLFGLKKPLVVGDTFPLTLKFKQAKPHTVTVKVQTGPATMPMHHDHGAMMQH